MVRHLTNSKQFFRPGRNVTYYSFLIHDLYRYNLDDTIPKAFGIYSIFNKNYDVIHADNTLLLPMFDYQLETIENRVRSN